MKPTGKHSQQLKCWKKIATRPLLLFIFGLSISAQCLSIDINTEFNDRVNTVQTHIKRDVNSISLDNRIDEEKSTTYTGPFQFGKTEPALSGSVTFTTPFAEIPKVFLMPTITPSNNDNDYRYNGSNPDGSATATITNVTKEGFTWQVEQPIYNKSSGGYVNNVDNTYGCKVGETCDNPTQPMEIHWIAATAGTHKLSDGQEVIVGSVSFPLNEKRALGMKKIDDRNNLTNTNKEPLSWLKVDKSKIGPEFSVVLNSRQAKTNNCFLTSVALPMARESGVGNRTGTYFMLDTANATLSGRDNTIDEDSNCLPPLPSGLAGSGPAKLVDEEIAYLAAKPGSGEFADADGTTVRYEFGSANTSTTNSTTENIDAQSRIQYSMNTYCSSYTPFTAKFDDQPTFIASKVSVNNNNTPTYGAGVYTYRADYVGGFLRRCNLKKSAVSVVNDESNTYNWWPRWSFPERYAFVALEREKPDTRQCFSDNFDYYNDESWATYASSSSTPIKTVNGRLRLTDNTTGQATAATYQRLFPIANNILEIEFDYYAYTPTVCCLMCGCGPGDGMAVVLSDSAITPVVGAPGRGLGYAADGGTPGFAGGWLGFGLDGYGNFAGQNKIRAKGSVASNFKTLGTSSELSNNPLEIKSSTPKFGDRYRFVIDTLSEPGKTNISVARRKQGVSTFTPIKFGGNAVTNIKGSNTDITNDLLLSFTSSTGAAYSYHELDNLEICAVHSKSIGQLVNHFRFEYSDTPSTCEPEAVKITACLNADCSKVVDEEAVTATLKPTGSSSITWSGKGVSGNTVTFYGGSTTVYLNNTEPSKVTFGVTNSVPGLQAFHSYDNTLCRQGVGNFSSAACTAEFKNAALVLDFTVGTKDSIANKQQDVLISAYKETDDPDATTCGPSLIDTTKNISFWSEYVNPVAGEMIGSPKISVTNNTGTVKTYEIGNNSTHKTSIPIAFDEKGQAKVKINYPDAGKVQLSVELLGEGADLGTDYNGSGQFVSFPDGLCLNVTDDNAACESSDASCSAFKAAGESFNLRVQAKAWQKDGDDNWCDNPIVTPNYRQNNIALNHVLVSPKGGNLGNLSVTQYDHQLGNATDTALSIDEVGVFQITAKAPLPYLDSSYYEIPESTSAPIGRFYPSSFAVENTDIAHTCSTFSYMDQPFTAKAIVTALNVDGHQTQNYRDDFIHSSLALTAENNNDGHDLSDRIEFVGTIAADRWDNGMLILNDKAKFHRTGSSSPDGPYANLDIGFQIIEPNTSIRSADTNPATSGDCTTTNDCNASLLQSGNDLRYGRVKLDNTYGAEKAELQMPAYTQYWDGNQWLTNDEDSCSSAYDYDFSTINKGENGANVEIVRYSEETFEHGEQILYWREKAPYAYRGPISAPLDVPDYLQWYWNGFSQSDPKATATFGKARGHNKIIYRRELFR